MSIYHHKNELTILGVLALSNFNIIARLLVSSQAISIPPNLPYQVFTVPV